MHYVGRQGWIILEGTRIRLDYAASRDCKRWICTQGGVGEGQVHNFIQATHRHSKGFKRQTGQNRHFRHFRAKGVSKQ